MTGTEAAKRYAMALLDLADGKGLMGKFKEALGRVQSSLETSLELREALMNPLVDAAAKVRVVEAVSGQKDATFRGFLELLAEKDRLRDLSAMARAYQLEADRREGVLEARVESAVGLLPGERTSLIRILEGRFQKKIRLIERINQDVLGGFRVVLEDEVLDYSLAAQLRRLGRRLRAQDAREVGEAL